MSRTITVDATELRKMLYDDADRSDLFGGLASEMRSRVGVNVIRIKLDVAQWKPFWADWLDALDAPGGG